MQRTLFRTLMFGAFVLAPVTNEAVAKTDTSSLPAGLKALVGKMVFLVIVITGGLVHAPISPMRWLVAATIIFCRGLVCVDPRDRGEFLRLGAAGGAIATIFIVPTLLVVLARSLLGLNLLQSMEKHSMCLLRMEQKGASVPSAIFGRF